MQHATCKHEPLFALNEMEDMLKSMANGPFFHAYQINKLFVNLILPAQMGISSYLHNRKVVNILLLI